MGRGRIPATTSQILSALLFDRLTLEHGRPVSPGHFEELSPDSGSAEPELLPPCQQVECEMNGATSQALRDAPHQSKVCGAGEDEASRDTLLVDGAFDRQEQLRRALNLIERERTRAPHERVGLLFGARHDLDASRVR